VAGCASGFDATIDVQGSGRAGAFCSFLALRLGTKIGVQEFSDSAVRKTDLLIVGAGPFGLAMAAYAKHLGIDHLLVGKPMGFWKANMPRGMLLRSGCDWHIDPLNIDTLEKFAQTNRLSTNEVEPLPLEFYLRYAQWFQEQKQLAVLPALVRKLDWNEGQAFPFYAIMDNGESVAARFVVLAVGLQYFKNVPSDLVKILPEGRYSHTSDLVEFEAIAGKRCLIIGGRQGAFEWAALMGETGVDQIHLCYRHGSPEFAPSDWSWMDPLVDATEQNPSWFRKLSEQEKDAIRTRLWAEGRLKIEPWLKARISNGRVKLWPKTRIEDCRESAAGDLAVRLDNGEKIAVDLIVLATGYKVAFGQIPFLQGSKILDLLNIQDGSPELDDHFQSNIPGMFITSKPAAQRFGPYFGITIAVRVSARLIGRFIVAELQGRAEPHVAKATAANAMPL
jgi:FAD-dependent urate hydroxylase